MTNIKIKTKGMHCKSCEILIKDSLEELDGVNWTEASYKSGTISVDFDEAKITKQQIKSAIKKEGYWVE